MNIMCSSTFSLLFTLDILTGKARAQAAGGQEFADFFTNLGVGTYESQVGLFDDRTRVNLCQFAANN